LQADFLLKPRESFMKNVLLLALLTAFALTFSSYTRPKVLAVSKTLAFPVAGKKANIGSYWGESRGGGKRKHEGIDIFARKGTPVVAICDGVIAAVGNEKIGGKTVWLQSDEHPWTAYYAHLDVQKVRTGQIVRKGQVIGTVGKTGNARHTPAHLHFGIYNRRGPVNPLPYVKNSPKVVPHSGNNLLEASLVKNSPVKNSKTEAKPAASSNKDQFTWKTIKVLSDPGGKYFVTENSSVVRLSNGQLRVIGRLERTNKGKFPYTIMLDNKQRLLVEKDGKLVTPSGKEVGNIS
jgi:hypothetical protein